MKATRYTVKHWNYATGSVYVRDLTRKGAVAEAKSRGPEQHNAVTGFTTLYRQLDLADGLGMIPIASRKWTAKRLTWWDGLGMIPIASRKWTAKRLTWWD